MINFDNQNIKNISVTITRYLIYSVYILLEPCRNKKNLLNLLTFRYKMCYLVTCNISLIYINFIIELTFKNQKYVKKGISL